MINYFYIYHALKYYVGNGFKELDVPWLAKEAAINQTMPPGCETMKIEGISLLGENRHLVASGEQSFVHMMLNDQLPEGIFCCCTPCFRDEKVLSELTRLYFLKVELIKYGNIDVINDVWIMVNIAYGFMKAFTSVKIVETGKNMFDLVDDDGIELGSYGHRQFDKHEWIYGTGVAEPRFSISSDNFRAKIKEGQTCQLAM